MESRSTIAAIATPPGASERGVIRISGARTVQLVEATCRFDDPAQRLGERALFHARFDDGEGELPALVLWMPGPRSFTREDVCELHLPGSPLLLACALERLVTLGAVPAPPGEFTRRAFLNGRIDLTQAEGVLELINARTDEERRAATALLLGGLDARTRATRDALESLRALCEASLDFDASDTGHVPVEQLAVLARGIDEQLAEALAFEVRRTPAGGEPRIVLVGAPNAGKSRLFNRLAERAPDGTLAIVSDLAGTTRDGRRGTWRLAGVDCLLSDTAGLDESQATDELEREAQAAARAALAGADLRLFVMDATRAGQGPNGTSGASGAIRALGGHRTLLVWNKIDRDDALAAPPAGLLPEDASWIAVSAATGAGCAELEAAAARSLGLEGGPPVRGPGGESGLSRELSVRHLRALVAAREEVTRALHGLAADAPLDLVAESLRQATSELDRISGRTTPEDLLDRIFSAFCIGK